MAIAPIQVDERNTQALRERPDEEYIHLQLAKAHNDGIDANGGANEVKPPVADGRQSKQLSVDLSQVSEARAKREVLLSSPSSRGAESRGDQLDGLEGALMSATSRSYAAQEPEEITSQRPPTSEE